MADGKITMAVGNLVQGLGKSISPNSLTMEIGDPFDEQDTEDAGGKGVINAQKNQNKANQNSQKNKTVNPDDY